MSDPTILWRRLDVPGHDSARVILRDTHWVVAGTAVFFHAGLPCRLDYSITCSSGWETAAANVTGWVGADDVSVIVASDSSGRWRLNGIEAPAVAGCTDIDLNFSPSTNLLPIRRLNLAIGESAEVTAAWLRFPGFQLEPLRQTYRRTGQTSYRYELAGGSFVRDLKVSEIGLVTDYPGFWSVEASS